MSLRHSVIRDSACFSRMRFKCSFTVVKPPLYCTGKWSCKMTCSSAMRQLQLPCNASARQFFSRNTKFARRTPRTCTRCSFRKFRVPGGDLTSWTVARQLQMAHCWRAGHLAASSPSTIQWGFYHREAALESHSGKIATDMIRSEHSSFRFKNIDSNVCVCVCLINEFKSTPKPLMIRNRCWGVTQLISEG